MSLWQTYGVQLPEVPTTSKVCAEAGLRAASGDPAQSAQGARGAEHKHSERLGQGRGQTIQNHGGVVEDISRQTVHLALRLQRHAEAMCEEDGGHAAHGVLEHGVEDRAGGRGRRISDTDTLKTGYESAGSATAHHPPPKSHLGRVDQTRMERLQ